MKVGTGIGAVIAGRGREVGTDAGGQAAEATWTPTSMTPTNRMATARTLIVVTELSPDWIKKFRERRGCQLLRWFRQVHRRPGPR